VSVGLAATANLLAALEDAWVRAPLWVATRGAVHPGPTDPPGNPHQATAWGLGQVLAAEQPERWGGLVDLPAVPDPRACDRLAAVLTGGSGEDQVAVRASGIFVRRLVRTTLTGTQTGPMWTPGGGTVLVTGAGSALGGEVVRWLAEQGAGALLLVVPPPAGSGGVARIAGELATKGVRVTAVTGDPADRATLLAALDLVPDGQPLTAVVHIAAELADGAAGPVDIEWLDRELTRVTAAAVNLDELTRDHELSAFVLVTSVCGTLGGPGLGNCAPAQAFLDAVARRRRALGRPALSVALGPSREPTGEPGTAEERLRQWGLGTVPPGAALAVLRRCREPGDGAVTVADIHWTELLAQVTAGRPVPLFDGVPQARRPVPVDAGPDPSMLARLAGAPAGEQLQLLLDLVCQHAAAVLGLAAADQVGPEASLLDLGLSSFTALELSTRLRAAGLHLPPVAVFDHPTPIALAHHLQAALAAPDGAPAPAPDQEGNPA
jgi:NAD(P)-dependent dehydrogenase (short-subunit alcohol dehydrogenase family)/aryl carrier-like protein